MDGTVFIIFHRQNNVYAEKKSSGFFSTAAAAAKPTELPPAAAAAGCVRKKCVKPAAIPLFRPTNQQDLVDALGTEQVSFSSFVFTPRRKEEGNPF